MILTLEINVAGMTEAHDRVLWILRTCKNTISICRRFYMFMRLICLCLKDTKLVREKKSFSPSRGNSSDAWMWWRHTSRFISKVWKLLAKPRSLNEETERKEKRVGNISRWDSIKSLKTRSAHLKTGSPWVPFLLLHDLQQYGNKLKAENWKWTFRRRKSWLTW
jgi:hypothetical protein